MPIELALLKTVPAPKIVGAGLGQVREEEFAVRCILQGFLAFASRPRNGPPGHRANMPFSERNTRPEPLHVRHSSAPRNLTPIGSQQMPSQCPASRDA